MMQIDELQAYRIHGIISSGSDSDTDFESKDEFDEEYHALKPPPFDYDSIRDRIVLISREQVTNVWQKRLETVEKDEEITQTVTSVTVQTKKKKKKKSKHTAAADNVKSTGIAELDPERFDAEFPELNRGKKDEKIEDIFENAVLFNNEDSKCDRIGPTSDLSETSGTVSPEHDETLSSSSNENCSSFVGSKPKKKGPGTGPYHDEQLGRLKDSEEVIWHSGMNQTAIELQLKLDRQRETSMYDFWMKLARNQLQLKESTNKKNEAVKKTAKTKKKSPCTAQSSMENLPGNGKELQVTQSVSHTTPSRLLSLETMQGTWHFDSFVQSNMQKVAVTGTKKKTKAKKKSKKHKAVKPTNENESSSNEGNSLERTTESYGNKSRTETDAAETPKESNDKRKGTPELRDKEMIEAVWMLPDNVDTAVRSTTAVQVKVEDTKQGDVTSTTANQPKTKKKKKKKTKQLLPATELVDRVTQSGEKTMEETAKLENQESIQQNSNSDVMSTENRENTRIINAAGTITRTTLLEVPQYVFDDELRDTEQNIIYDKTIIVPNLSIFTTKRNGNKSQMETDATETLKESYDEVKQTLEQLGKEITEPVGISLDNAGTDVQSTTPIQTKVEDTRQGEIMSTAVDQPKTKKKKKKTKQPLPATELVLYCGTENQENTRISNVEGTINQTTLLEEPQYVFDDELRDPVHNIIYDETITVPNLSSFTTEKDGNKSQMETDTTETSKESHEEERRTPKLPGNDIMESVWILPDNVGSEVQSTTTVQATANEAKTKMKKRGRKKKKPKQPVPPTDLGNRVDQNDEKTTEEIKKISNAANQTTLLEEPQYVFDEEFRSFIRDIICEGSNVVPNLTSFRYEQLHRAYMAYRAKKYRDVSTNTVSTQSLPQQNHLHTFYVGHPTPNVIFPLTPMTNYWNGTARTPDSPQMRGNGNYLRGSGIAVTYSNRNSHKSSQTDERLSQNGSMPNNPYINGNGTTFNDGATENYWAPSHSGLRYHSAGPNDNFRPNAYQTPTWDTPTAGSWCWNDFRTADWRENVIFNRGKARSSWEKLYYQDHSPKQERDLVEARLAENASPLEHRISCYQPETSWDKNSQDIDEVVATLFYFLIVGLLGISVANLITCFVSFLFDNILFVVLLIIICINFQPQHM